MKKIILALVIALISAWANPSFAVNYPEFQHRFVNDFAGLLNEQDKAKAEKQLDEFELRTGNEFIVAIIPTLQGENIEIYALNLFNTWKIGKKKNDNGLLLLISPKERKMRFETGNGLEGIMTDAVCSRINRNILKPNFRNGEFGKGINEAIAEATRIIAPPPPKVLTPAERQRIAEESKAKHKAMLAEQKRQEQLRTAALNTIFFIAGFLATFAVIYFSLSWIYKTLKRRRKEREQIAFMRQRLTTQLKKNESEISNLKSRLSETENIRNELPAWFNSEFDSTSTSAKSLLLSLDHYLPAALKLLNEGEELRDCDLLSRTVGEKTREAYDLVLELENFPVKARQLAGEANAAIKNTNAMIAAVDSRREAMIKEGYQIDDSSKTDSLQAIMRSLEKELKDARDPRSVKKTVEINLERVKVCDTTLQTIVRRRETNNKMVESLLSHIPRLNRELASVKNIFEKLSTENPEEAWKQFKVPLSQCGSVLEKTASEIELAEKLNSMDQQKFFEAQNAINRAELNISNAEELFGAIRSTHSQIEAAKNMFTANIAKAEQAINKAKKKANEDDVEPKRKREAAEAEAQLLSVKTSTRENRLVNWIEVTSALAAIATVAALIIKNAENDIADAAAVRAAKEQENDKEDDSDDEDKTTFFNDSHDSAPDDNAFDCGGGMSSGGGASDDW